MLPPTTFVTITNQKCQLYHFWSPDFWSPEVCTIPTFHAHFEQHCTAIYNVPSQSVHNSSVSCTLRAIPCHNPQLFLPKYAQFQHSVHTSSNTVPRSTPFPLEVCTIPAFHAHFEQQHATIRNFSSRSMHNSSVSCTLRAIPCHNPQLFLSKCAQFQRFMHTSSNTMPQSITFPPEVCTIPAFHAHFEQQHVTIRHFPSRSVHSSRVSCTLRATPCHNPQLFLPKYAQFQRFMHTSSNTVPQSTPFPPDR